MTHTKDEALRKALAALGLVDDDIQWQERSVTRKVVLKAITAIKQALAAPVQEPVALEAIYETVIHWDEGGGKRSRRELARRIVALYPTPPAAQPAPTVQEPEYWNVIDPAGNIVASETDAIRGWARIAGSYKPTVEGLLGFHDQGWRVLPKAAPPAQPAIPDALTSADTQEHIEYVAGWNDCRQAMMEMMK